MAAARRWVTVLVAASAGVCGFAAPRGARAQGGGSTSPASADGPTPDGRDACEPTPGQPVRRAAGRRIEAITVVTTPPDPLPGGMRVPFHVTTRPDAVRNRLLFSVGQTLDTLRVAESLRELQTVPYLLDARITVACGATGGTTLTVSTRDAWSIRPEFSVRGSQRATLGLAETNLFGTGRSARLYARSDLGQLGVGAGYVDPTLFGGHAVGSAHRDAYSDGRGWGATLRTWDAGVFAPWGAGVAVQQSSHASVRRSAYSAPGDTVRRATLQALVSRRLTLDRHGATFLRLGVEGERTALAAGPQLPIVGPASVRRTFVGADVGLARRGAEYVAAPWLLPAGSEPLRLGLTRPEVPLGLEAEGLVSVGRDVTARGAATHVDVWTGRIIPLGRRSVDGAPRALVSADAWASGYHPLGAGGEWSAGTVRAVLGAVAPAGGGLWSARLSAEHLIDPDPDVRSLALIDPVQRALPESGRLAESALTGSLERSHHLFGLTRNYVLDAALFGAGSVRWEGATPRGATLGTALVDRAPRSGMDGAERLFVGSVGAGLRITPTHFGPATIRVDAGIPVVHSRALHGRPFFGITITPAFGIGRQRDGRGVLGGI